jgi:hypothetical protein
MIQKHPQTGWNEDKTRIVLSGEEEVSKDQGSCVPALLNSRV